MNLLKTQTRTVLCLLLLVGFLAVNNACLAQGLVGEDSEGFAFDSDESYKKMVEKYSKPNLDIDMEKPESVDSFADVLRQRFEGKTGEPLNIVIAKDARKVMIPSMFLKQVSVLSVLQAIQVATQGELRCDFASEGLIQIGRRPESNSAKASVRVFNVGNIVDSSDKAEASLLSAIEIGLELVESSPEKISLKFHKETKLLFIRGSSTDIDIVMQVIDQVEAGLSKPKPKHSDMEDDGGGFGAG